jgi:5-methylthioadenosine/S-adenosylhomocysteine deaminase
MRKAYGKGSVEYLHGLGYLSPRFVGAHCVFMTPAEVGIMKDTGAHMSHTAYLVGKRGYFPPMDEVYRQGVSVSIGADWLSNDVFKTLRAAILLARHQAKSTTIINGPRVLEFATLGGARALGLEREIGSLEVGKRADLFLLNLRLPWLNPIRPQNIVSNIVYNANGSDVTDVVIDGRIVVEDGRCVTVDETEAFRECERVARTVWERARPLLG